MRLSNKIEDFLAFSQLNEGGIGISEKLFTIKKDNQLLSCAGLIYNENLHYKNYKKIGQIGFFKSVNDKKAASYLFEEIKKYAKNQGFDYLIGPMEGSTYKKYRLKTTNNPCFFLDVDNADYYQELFKNSGFKVISNYCSTIYKNLDKNYKRLDKFEQIFKDKKITIDEFDPQNFDSQIKQIFDITSCSFVNNFLYSPIEFEEFYTMYEPIKKFLDPKFVLIAKNEQLNPIAFIFCYPDFFNKTKKTLVIKTLAQIEDSKYRGLGSYLVEYIHKKAHFLGYNQIIHALMHINNVSKNIIKGGEIYQQYELLGVEL